MENNAVIETAGFKYLGVRIHHGAAPSVGETLDNSWHNATECDWVEADTELDGTCCFLLDSKDGESLKGALEYARCQWPGEHTVLLIGSDAKGEDAIPEEGAGLLWKPVVLASWVESL